MAQKINEGPHKNYPKVLRLGEVRWVRPTTLVGSETVPEFKLGFHELWFLLSMVDAGEGRGTNLGNNKIH